MARTRSFDEAEVLWAAMNAFRKHGYTRVSVRQLERATGLTSGSLYNAFGDKDGLFEAALAHYVSAFVAGRVGVHAGPAATLDDLEGLFLSILREPLADGFGCLVTNSAVEFGSAQSVASRGVRDGLQLVERGIRGVLEREIGAARAARETTHLVLLYHGLLVLSRAGTGGPGGFTEFAAVVADHFDRLRALRRAPGRPRRTRRR